MMTQDDEDDYQDDEDLEGGSANTTLKATPDSHDTTTPETFFDNFSSWRTDQQQERQTELADLKPSNVKPVVKPPSMLTMSENEIDSKRN